MTSGIRVKYTLAISGAGAVMRDLAASPVPVWALFVSVVLLAYLVMVATASAQEAGCETSRIIIEGGNPSPFVLPDNAGETLRLNPTTVLKVSGENFPPNATIRWSLSGIGVTIDQEIRPVGTTPASVDLAKYSKYVRGAFRLEGTLLSDQGKVCTTSFLATISGFGGTVAKVATAATAVSGAGALAGAAYAGNGANAKLKLKVRVERRRPTGWRRWVPVPAWKRLITGTIVGAVAGFAGTILLQQSGITPLSLTAAMWGTVWGGGATFGVGLSFGVLLTFLRPPVEEAM
jgi:hypothetical protein